MKVYISLPITGKDLQQQKRHADNVAAFLLTAGFTPVTPFGKQGVPDDAPYETHVREDLKLMLDCGAVYLCNGYHYSKGCLFERDVAVKCGLTIVKESMPIDKIYRMLKLKEHERDKIQGQTPH